MAVKDYTEANIKNILNLLQPKYVDRPPAELVTYRNLNKYDKAKEAEKFFKQGYIQEFLDDKWTIELYNKVCFQDLYQYYHDFPNLQKDIAKKLCDFKNVMEKQEYAYPALKLDFSKYLFDETALDEVIVWEE